MALFAAATAIFAGGMGMGAVVLRAVGELKDEEEDETTTTEEAVKKKLRPVVVCGPSGVGKGTLISMLLKEFGDKVGFSVSHTTRAPREGEVDGTHYHFSTVEEMEKMIAAGDFVEYARVHGNIYGTSKASVRAVASEGKVCVLDIDVQGAKSVTEADIGAHFIFILPPDVKVLEQRLRGRGTDMEEAIQKRMKNAVDELAQTELPLWDAKIVNEDKEEAYVEFRASIAENCMGQ